MIIKQIAIDEALELHKRGLMVGVLQPVVPEPKNLDAASRAIQGRGRRKARCLCRLARSLHGSI